MKNVKRGILIGLVTLSLVSLACGLSLQDGKLTIPITLNEDTIKRLLGTSQSAVANNTWVEVQDIQFIEPDKIRATGNYLVNSTQRVNGEVELTFSVVNNQPDVEITWVNIPGLDLASDAVQKANDALSQVLRDQVRENGADAVIKSITVEGDALKILVEVPVRRQN